MTPKELLAAAEDVKLAYEQWDGGPVGCEFSDACAQHLGDMLDHILATVHVDDDEPVDGEWLVSIGWHWNRELYWWIDCNETTNDFVSIGIYRFDGSMFVEIDGDSNVELKTRGQLRALLRGLGIPNKEGA